jgi:hypothetical protein
MHKNFLWYVGGKKGSPVHLAPACAGFGEGSNQLGSYVRQPFPAFLQEAVPKT